MYWHAFLTTEIKLPDKITAQKMKKSLTENIIFCAVYSRRCLTSAAQSFFKYRPSRHVKLLRIKPTITFVFLIFADIWRAYCKSPSRITPTSFHSNTCSKSWLWSIIKHFFLPECQRHEKPALPKCKMDEYQKATTDFMLADLLRNLNKLNVSSMLVNKTWRRLC